MSLRLFHKALDEPAIVRAIQEAEGKTSAEIRVFITHHKPKDVLAAAQDQFLRLGMERTPQRNGVLIYVAPQVRRFAVIGDQGIHQHVGEQHWQVIVAATGDHFRKGDFTAGLIHAIQTAGSALGQHFPRRADDRNELPDQIAHD